MRLLRALAHLVLALALIGRCGSSCASHRLRARRGCPSVPSTWTTTPPAFRLRTPRTIMELLQRAPGAQTRRMPNGVLLHPFPVAARAFGPSAVEFFCAVRYPKRRDPPRGGPMLPNLEYRSPSLKRPWSNGLTAAAHRSGGTAHFAILWRELCIPSQSSHRDAHVHVTRRARPRACGRVELHPAWRRQRSA